MTELICIACPKGCRLHVDDVLNVTGNDCPRGETYAQDEVQNPVRTLTSTVRIEGGAHRRCPVKTAGEIPKGMIFDAMRALDSICLKSPVSAGHIVVGDICGTGVSFVTTRDM